MGICFVSFGETSQKKRINMKRTGVICFFILCLLISGGLGGFQWTCNDYCENYFLDQFTNPCSACPCYKKNPENFLGPEVTGNGPKMDQKFENEYSENVRTMSPQITLSMDSNVCSNKFCKDSD